MVILPHSLFNHSAGKDDPAGFLMKTQPCTLPKPQWPHEVLVLPGMLVQFDPWADSTAPSVATLSPCSPRRLCSYLVEEDDSPRAHTASPECQKCQVSPQVKITSSKPVPIETFTPYLHGHTPLPCVTEGNETLTVISESN